MTKRFSSKFLERFFSVRLVKKNSYPYVENANDLFVLEQAALVACKQLGYVDGEGRYAAHFGSGAGPVHITHVSCLGTEDHLQECFLSYAEDDLSLHQCTHSNDVGIQCIGKNTSPYST